ncbi:NUDIX domain-containing protein [Nocardia sp. NPDC059239]|uniref:NUDIX domain-containing protein n=1 Tax=unclassified Nocardia TaxID=2637762 RepID=UPI0036739486
MRGDGNGWFRDLDGVRHWGRYGAAGLLLRVPLAESDSSAVLLQLRARGRAGTRGTWTIPGGACDSHESAVEAALREAWEETGIDPGRVVIRGERVTTRVPGGWTFTTVVGDARTAAPVRPDHETHAVRWVPESEVAALPLHPDFREAWPRLRAEPVYLLLDNGFHRGAGQVLPRTVEVSGQGFVWLHRSGEPTGRTTRFVTGPLPYYQRPGEQLLLHRGQVFPESVTPS